MDQSRNTGLIGKLVNVYGKLSMLLSRILYCLLVGLVVSGASQAAAKPSRAVSMNAIAGAFKSGAGTDKAWNLCGITRLCGFIPDAETKDIILLGVVDPESPPLHLEDMVTAMRNVYGRYAKTIGRTIYYSDPGCSIDPNPAVLQQLRDFDESQSQSTDPEIMQARTEAWKAIGRQPQKVRVLGVPFDSRFAKVMVDADYYMKRLVNGSVDLGIPGFKSLSDLDIDAQRLALHSGTASKLAGGSMNRFWFSPGESTYEVRGGATLLRSCEVKLLTEAEYLNEHGAIAQMGRPDPSAARFAESFSTKYNQIAAQRPIYKELQALFSMVAIARLMKDGHVERTAGASIGYLLGSLRLPCVPVSRAVNGLTDVRLVTETLKTAGGERQYHLIQSSCGGVSMNVRPKRLKTTAAPRAAGSSQPTHRSPSTSKAAPTTAMSATPAKAIKSPAAAGVSIKRAVLNARKSRATMSWDVPIELD